MRHSRSSNRRARPVSALFVEGLEGRRLLSTGGIGSPIAFLDNAGDPGAEIDLAPAGSESESTSSSIGDIVVQSSEATVAQRAASSPGLENEDGWGGRVTEDAASSQAGASSSPAVPASPTPSPTPAVTVPVVSPVIPARVVWAQETEGGRSTAADAQPEHASSSVAVPAMAASASEPSAVGSAESSGELPQPDESGAASASAPSRGTTALPGGGVVPVLGSGALGTPGSAPVASVPVVIPAGVSPGVIAIPRAGLTREGSESPQAEPPAIPAVLAPGAIAGIATAVAEAGAEASPRLVSPEAIEDSAAVQNLGQEFPATGTSDVLTSFLPFDRATVENAIDAFLEHVEGLGGEFSELGSVAGSIPGLTAFAIVAGASHMILRRRRSRADRLVASDDAAEVLDRFTGQTGLWNLGEI